MISLKHIMSSTFSSCIYSASDTAHSNSSYSKCVNISQDISVLRPTFEFWAFCCLGLFDSCHDWSVFNAGSAVFQTFNGSDRM